jgi:tryptophanyl-tRNA synthetase
MQERRAKYEKDPALVKEIVHAGNQRATQVAEATMEQARAALGMSKELL